MKKFSYRIQVIKAAYNNAQLRPHLPALLKEASFMDAWGDKKFTNPDTGRQIKVKSLNPEKPAQKALLDKLREVHNKNKEKSKKRKEQRARRKEKSKVVPPRGERPFKTKVSLPYQSKRTPTNVEKKYKLEEVDEEELFNKAHRYSRTPGDTPKKTMAEVMREFLAKAKPETRERMKGMSLADFEVMYLAVMDDEDVDID